MSYPDLDNLAVLSDLYDVSTDFLLKGKTISNETSEKIVLEKNPQDIYKSFAIIATALLSCLVPLIGFILNLGIIIFCIIKKEKLASWVWMILIVCLIINFFNAIIVLDGYFFKYGRATVEKVALLII